MGELFSNINMHVEGASHFAVPNDTNISDLVVEQMRPSNDNMINFSALEITQKYQFLHMELEQVSQQLAGYLKHILNDPDLYYDIIYKFFNAHQIFQMIPLVALFRD
jgi:hypothetical protein